MRRISAISRLKTLMLATLACALIATVAPMVLPPRATEEPFLGYSVLASPRDLHVVAQPIRLSAAPDLTLSKGVLYADGNAALGTPISKFVLDGPVFYLNVSGTQAASGFEGPTGSTDRASVAPLLDQLIAMSFDALTIRRGTLHVMTAAGPAETVADIQAEVFGSRKGQVTSKGSFIFRGQRLTFDTTLAQPPEKQQEKKLWVAKATVQGAPIQAAFDGNIDVAGEMRVTGHVDLSTTSLRKVGGWFGLPIPTAEGLNAASLKGQLTWAGGSVVVDEGKIAVDGSEATGGVAFSYAGERPLLEGTLAFNRLNLTPYFESLRSQSFIFDRRTWSWSTFDFSFPMLNAVDADLRISASALAFKNSDLGGGAATITARSGKLIANVVELDLLGGKASGRVTADVTEPVPRYALQGKVDNFDPSAAIAMLIGMPMLSGRSAMKLDLKSAGQTPAEVLRNLSGKAGVTTEQGKVGFDVKALRANTKGGITIAASQLSKGSTSVEALDARVQVVDGVLVAENVMARGGGLHLSAAGSADLLDRTLDARLTVRAIDPADKVSRTVVVTGPWTDPAIRRDEAADVPVR